MANKSNTIHGNGDGENKEGGLERIKRHLSSSALFLLQGPLLKRSETLRKWNQRWFTLDPTTGKMDYRLQRGDLSPKGLIYFDTNSTITVSPINFQGLVKYEGCCIYIGTAQKKEYFLCAETSSAAHAWVATLRATQLVLKAHKEAVNSISGNGTSNLGTVAAAVAAANATARESSKEIEAALHVSLKAALHSKGQKESDGVMDDLTIMKETLRVKDEELHQLSRELRAKDLTVKELAEHLTETADAAEAAASAAHIMDKERKAARDEITRLRLELDDKLHSAMLEIRKVEEKLASSEKSRDEAFVEAQTWRVELGKAREHAIVMEAAVLRAEEGVRMASLEAELKIKASLEAQKASENAKEEALRELENLRAQLARYQAWSGAMASNNSCAQGMEGGYEYAQGFCYESQNPNSDSPSFVQNDSSGGQYSILDAHLDLKENVSLDKSEQGDIISSPRILPNGTDMLSIAESGNITKPDF